METTTNYTEQANDFMVKVGATMKIDYLKNAYHFDGDKETRDIYRITLKREGRRYSFNFGQSIANSRTNTAPTAYDVLTCLTKYDPGTFENFCGDFGYDEDSRRAEKVYKAVLKEWAGVERLFGDVIEELVEIA
jgi:hypothetical protein